MKTIILAAGKSTRLMPLTKDLPKCLLKINGKSIINYQIDALLDNKVEKIAVVVGFNSSKIIQHLKENYPEVNFTFIENKEFDTTSASYSLWLAKKYMEDEFLYLNSDLFCHPEIIKNVIEHNEPNITAIQKIHWNEEAVNVTLDKNGLIADIGKHIKETSSHGEFIGITKINKNFTEKLISSLEKLIDNGDKKRYAVDAINAAIKLGGKIYALDVTHLPAIEIDTLEDYENAKNL